MKLVTRPVFSFDPAKWPVLEIGTAALIFRRHGADGELALAIGDNAPASLPLAIELNAEERSTEPLAVSFSRSGSEVTVNLYGQTFTFPAGPTERRVDVVASAGASQTWTLENLTVIVTTPNTAPDTGGKTPETGSSLNDGMATTRESSPKESVPAQPGSGSSSEGAHPIAAAKAVDVAGSGRSSALEIFTPPSVRPGRADALRSAAAKKPPQ